MYLKKARPTELEQLISDYHRDNAKILREKVKWLPLKPIDLNTRTNRKDNMPYKPKVDRDEMGTEDSPVDQYQGDKHKNKKSSNKLLDPSIVLPKKKAGGKPPMSPILQVMKAVTDRALNPKRKKAPSIKSGPSKANIKKPQKGARVDKGDGPSAEEDGEA